MAKDKIILYDIRKRNYPNKRGDDFRSLQVFECWVCGTFTNQVVMGGYPGYGVRAVCPQSAECWHHELEDKIKLLAQPHPQTYKAELQREIEEIKEKNKKRIKNDILGSPDFSLKQSVTNVHSFNRKSGKCTHLF